MSLQLPRKEFLLVIFCINCFLIPYTACKIVRCKGEVNKGKCHCREIRSDETPWPKKKNSPTAPKPENASMKMKAFDEKLYPKIKWTLSKQFVKHVDGFYLEVWLLPNSYTFYYCVQNSSMILKNSHDSLVVAYEFRECCRSFYNGFENGNELRLKVHSLPMYSADQTTHFAFASLTVGDEPEIAERGTSEPDSEYYVNVVNYRNELREIHSTLHDLKKKFLQEDDTRINVVTVVVAVVVTFIVCAFGMCLFAAYLRRRPHNLQNARTIRRVLLIGDEDEYCIKLVNGFIETMKKSSNASVDVVSNIRKTSEIASAGIITWTSENFRQADVVVMLINDPSQVKSAFAMKKEDEEFKKSPVNVALNVAESEAVKSTFRMCKKKFVVVQSHSNEIKSLAFCTHYILKKHFKEILKHVLGDFYVSSVDVKEDYDRLLTIGKENDDGGVTECLDVRKKTNTDTPINNLDVSLSRDQIELTSEVNDFSMVNRNNPRSNYHSVENNENGLMTI